MDFMKRTKELWHIYFSANREENLGILDWLAEDCVIIGTGAHEFYLGFKDFISALEKEIAERRDISFKFKNFWCQQRKISSEICLVYGGLYLLGESKDKNVIIDMDSRFSMIYQRIQGKWKIINIHQSLPNPEQMEGEYYPKTLVRQIQEAKTAADEMEKLAEKDDLTGLMNYRALKKYWKEWNQKDGWLFIIDMDDFKKINDTFGHLAGNQVLKKAAELFCLSVGRKDLVCRIGGDEFILLCGGLQKKEEAESLVQKILLNARKSSTEDVSSLRLSIGGTRIGRNESLDQVLQRADQALYAVKRGTKNNYRLSLTE